MISITQGCTSSNTLCERVNNVHCTYSCSKIDAEQAEGKREENMEEGKREENIEEGKREENMEEGKREKNMEEGKREENMEEGKREKNMEEGKREKNIKEGREKNTKEEREKFREREINIQEMVDTSLKKCEKGTGVLVERSDLIKKAIQESGVQVEYKGGCIIKEKMQKKYICIPYDGFPGNSHISDHDIYLLHKAHHDDPFRILGAHYFCTRDIPDLKNEVAIIVRSWIRNAEEVRLTLSETISDVKFDNSVSGAAVEMNRACDWLFQKVFIIRDLENKPINQDTFPRFRYELLVKYDQNPESEEKHVIDSYQFHLLLPEYDMKLFQSGSCWHVDDLLGSHHMYVDGIRGVRFAVWSPSSLFVSVVGDFNGWDGRAHPMRKRHEFGIWEIFIPGEYFGNKYGYRIHSVNKTDSVKIDPYAQQFEIPPATASIISDCDDSYKSVDERFKWTDDEWLKTRVQLGKTDTLRRQPMAIYEVHLPSWMRGENNSYLSYRELADRLVCHVKNLNFQYVEFLPLTQHPFQGSWGYQVTGQYAPYSLLGNPDDFKYLVNTLHENGIGVFMDFVLGHFCKDDWGIVYYDGTPCYEYADPKEGEHKTWGTMVFNYRRNEVRSFLLGAAYHWLRRYHIDGLRIDAVSSMLYKNHFRLDGEWIPNEHGGHENLQAISLLQELNWVIHKEFPGVFTMAEESTSWEGVTNKEKGLGFDAKWDLGWMNDVLSYLCMPVPERFKKHDKLTFRGLYVAHEKWILPLSHDEVVSGKGSLVDKCGYKTAPFEERITTLKALYGLQIGQPGRPLIFMGGEIGQGREWKENRSVDWHEGKEELRSKLCIWLSDLLAVYKHHKALHAGDDESWNFKWTDCDNKCDNIVAFIRSYMEWYNDILVVCNFSGKDYYNYPFGVSHGGKWKVLLNSDDWRYGGKMKGPGNYSHVQTTQGGRLGWPYCLWFDVPAFSCLFLKAPTPQDLTVKGENKNKADENTNKPNMKYFEKNIENCDSSINQDDNMQ